MYDHSTIMTHLNLQSKIANEWEYLTNKTVSDFLTRKGWPFSKNSFIQAYFGNDKLDERFGEVEFSKYGQCCTFKNLPAQKIEGSSHGFKILLNIMHNAYPVSEFGIGDDIKGASSGVRVFIDDVESDYFDYRHGRDLSIGSVNSLGITKRVDKYLPPPHGICNNTVKFKTDSSCLYDWYTKQVIKNCDCRTFFQKNSSVEECTLQRVINCKDFLKNLKNQKPPNSTCPQLCEEIKYKIDYTSTTSIIHGL